MELVQRLICSTYDVADRTCKKSGLSKTTLAGAGTLTSKVDSINIKRSDIRYLLAGKASRCLLCCRFDSAKYFCGFPAGDHVMSERAH